MTSIRMASVSWGRSKVHGHEELET